MKNIPYDIILSIFNIFKVSLKNSNNFDNSIKVYRIIYGKWYVDKAEGECLKAVLSDKGKKEKRIKYEGIRMNLLYSYILIEMCFGYNSN